MRLFKTKSGKICPGEYMGRIIPVLLFIIFYVSGPIFAELKKDDLELIKQAVQLREKKPELFKSAKGVLITQVVKDSQADKKGFRPGDIIISYNGQAVDSAKQFVNSIKLNTDKPLVEIQFIRNNYLKKTTLQGGQIGIRLVNITAEMPVQDFIEKFIEATVKQNIDSLRQLVLENPNTAEKTRQILADTGKGEGKNAETAKHISNTIADIMEISKDHNPNTIEMKRLNNEGETAFYSADYNQALAKWKNGLELAKKAENKEYIGIFLANLGVVYRNLGQYDKALSYYNNALELKKEIKDRQGEGTVLSNTGVVYDSMGDHAKALSYYLSALEIRKEFKDLKGQSSDLNNIGLVYYSIGEYDKALSYYNKALVIDQKIGDQRGKGADLANIGLVYYSLGENDKALSHYEQALKIRRETNDRKGEATNLSNIGLVYHSLEDNDKALSYFEQSLEIRREIRDRTGEGADLSNIGVAYYSLGDYKKALSYYKQALEIRKQVRDRQGEGSDLSNIGVVYYSQAEYKKALSYFDQSLEIRKEVRDRKGEGTDLSNIGVVYDCLGNYDKALSYHNQALEIRKEIRDSKGESFDLTNIGLVYYSLGQYDKALWYYEQAFEIDQKNKDQRGTGIDFNNMGLVYYSLGEYDKALSYYYRALDIKKEIRDRNGESSTLSNIGVIYRNLGQYEKALSYYNQALKIKEEIGDQSGKVAALSNIGVIYYYSGDYGKALSYYNQALEIDRKIGDQRGESSDLTNIGIIYRYLGQYDKALSYYNQALELKKTTGDRRGEGADLSNIGVVYSFLKEYDKAWQSFSKSIAIFSEIGSRDMAGMALRGLASTEALLGKHENAVTQYENALDNIESVRTGISESESRISYMQEKLHVYDEFIEFLNTVHIKESDKNYDKKSFEIFERKQSRVFLEQMGKSGAKNFAGLPDEIRADITELENRISKFQNELVNERSKSLKDRNTERIRHMGQQLEKARAEKETTEKIIKKNYPDYYALKYPQPSSFKDFKQNILLPGEAMLIYGVMEKMTCLWIISKDQFEFCPVEIDRKTLTDKVKHFRKGLNALLKAIETEQLLFTIKKIARKSKKQLHQDGSELYGLLVPKKIRTIISQAEILYVIPSSCLYELPFEALVTQTDEKGVRYLVEDHPIAYLSSASLLKIIRESQARKKEKATRPLLAFANPVYGTKENPCFGTTRGPADDNNNPAFSEMRVRAYYDLMGRKLCELPETEDEVKEIRTIMEASDDSIQIRQEASRSNVLKLNKQGRLDDCRYVIFSCHGLLPEEINQLTQPALLLTHPDPETGKQGLLTMADVFGIRLNADLVTLSACNTGRGTLQKGEGVRGLTRAFMYAGTPAVSVTLWSVESESAKTLSTDLYKNLKAGMTRAEALREIKLRMIRGEEGKLFKHPFFWAPVVIFGDAG